MTYPLEEPPTPTTDREGEAELEGAITAVEELSGMVDDINTDPAGYDLSDYAKMAKAVLDDWRDAAQQAKEETRVIR